MAKYGFVPHATDDGHVVPWVHNMLVASGTYKVGQALVISSGKLVSVSSGVGEDTDEGAHYISMFEGTLAADGYMPVIAAKPDIEFDVALDTADANLAVGTSYTIKSDGMTITSTTTKGCFKVIAYTGKAVDDIVTGILI